MWAKNVQFDSSEKSTEASFSDKISQIFTESILWQKGEKLLMRDWIL